MSSELDNQRLVATAIKTLKSKQRAMSFDPWLPESRPNLKQETILKDIQHYQHRWVVAANQTGKTATGAREAAWIFTNSHPWFTPPEEWGNSPLLMIIIGRTLQQVYENIWCEKLRPFLDPSEYKEEKTGGVVTAIRNRKNKNTILFFSHHSPEEAREKVQGFVANWVWLDEMPDSAKLIEELHRRCVAKRGRFLATFTPKLRNQEIRKMAEVISPYQKMYKMAMLDNPIYSGREQEVLATLEGLAEDYRRTVEFGDWYTGDSAVYSFNMEKHCTITEGYHPSWRHIESIDPASSGLAGHVVLAESPTTGIWHVLHANYIKGASAKNLLVEMDKTRGNVNLVRRIADPHENWFIKHAADDGITFDGVWKKNERKQELIKNLQKALDESRIRISPLLDKLIAEFTTCQWSETASGKIIGSRRFHLLDALQYAVDNLPTRLEQAPTKPVTQWLREANRVRIKKQADTQVQQAKLTRGRLVAKRGKVLRHAM